MDFLGAFVGSTVRAKVLRLFIFNEKETYTIAEVAKRAQVSREAAQKEVNYLKRLQIVERDATATKEKKVSAYILSTTSQHLRALQLFVRETSAIDHGQITTRLRSAGRLKLVVASGTFVDDASGRVDLLIVGDTLDERKLQNALRSVEADLGRELRYASFLTDEFNYRLTIYDKLIRDILDYPHQVFLDKLGVTRL